MKKMIKDIKAGETVELVSGFKTVKEVVCNGNDVTLIYEDGSCTYCVADDEIYTYEIFA